MKRFHPVEKKSERRGSVDSRRKSARRSLEIMALESRLLLTFDATSTVLASSASTLGYGHLLVLTATVTDVTDGILTPSDGTVTFKDGTTTLGTAPVSSGTATYESLTLPIGTHDFTADYGGSAPWAASNSGLSASSTIQTVVGTGTAGYSGDSGPASSAAINAPYAIVYNAQGDLFIADAYNNVVREVTTDGIIHTIAGDGEPSYSGDSGPATSAELNTPEGLAFNSAGDLFIADSGNNVIREITTDGIIHTVAGNGTRDSGGNGGPATSAELDTPEGLAVDAAGNVYVASNDSKSVRMFTPGGNIQAFAGTGIGGYSGDGDLATSAKVQPSNVLVDSAGNVFIADLANSVVREVTTDGIIHTIAGNGTYGYSGDGGPATSAKLSNPEGMAMDASGDLFFSDALNNVVREVTPDGIIHTIAGNGTAGLSGDGGPASSAELNFPYGLAFDSAGDLLIGQYGDSVIREVQAAVPVTVTPPATTTTTLTASSSSIASGQTLTLTVHVTDANEDSISGGMVTFKDGTTTLDTATLANGMASLPVSTLALGQHFLTASYAGTTGYLASASGLSGTSTINTIAGNGNGGFSGIPGPATSAEFNPNHAVVDAQGDIYISDATNNYVYKVTPAGVISIFAGDGSGGDSGDGGPATSAAIGRPVGLSIDASGDVFIDSYGSQGVREVTPDGIIHNVAGNGSGGYSGDTGPATSAELGNPSDVAVDAAGDIFIADSTNQVVREVTTDGIIHTFAGTGSSGYSGDGGAATAAQLHYPTGVAVDAAGDVFIDDHDSNVIREVTPDGIIHTVAGDGTSGYSGDGGLATSAELSGPQSVAVNAAGDLFIADTGNNVVREVTPDGIIHTIAGTGTSGYTGDGSAASAAELDGPTGVSLDATGDLFISDSGNSVIREVGAALPVTVTANQTATALISSSASIAAGSTLTFTATVTNLDGETAPTGDVAFMDGSTTLGTEALVDGVATFMTSSLAQGEHYVTAVYEGAEGYIESNSGITATSTIRTVAGDGGGGYTGDGGMATGAELSYPTATISDASGNLYIADFGNNVIRKVTPAGVISTYAGNGAAGYSGDGGQASSAELNHPVAMAFDASGDLFIADYNNNVIREVTPEGVISTYAGDNAAGYGGDGGPATSAQLQQPDALIFDASGDLFIADENNHVVREVTPEGVISTYAGNGDGGYSGDGGQATSAELAKPAGLALDASGDLFISDCGANVVREVTPEGVISTYAGNGTAGGSGDGGPATSAQLNDCYGIAMDAWGDLFIADIRNSAVREVTPDGEIVTVAGNGSDGYSGDGGPAGSAALNNPEYVSLDSRGDLFVADISNNVIREVYTGVSINVTAPPATHFTVTGLPMNVSAGTAETITVTALDANGNVVPGYTGTVQLTSSDGQAILPGNSTLTSGVGTFQVTLKTAATESITVTDTGNSELTGTESGIHVTPASAASLVVTGATSNTAGGIETVTVTAHDAFGNVATGYSGMVQITSSDGQAALPPDASLSSGVGSFDVKLETVGLQSITATDTGNSAITGIDSGIDITPSTATHYVVISNPANPTAGATITVTVTAYDAYGNVATGYNGTAHITSGDIQAVLPPDAALIEGVGTFQVTLETAATESITAVDTSNSDVTGTESNLNVSPGLPIDLVVTSSTNDPIAGEPITVTATAYDAYGNIVTNLEDITVYLSSSDGQAILPPGGSPIINGVATFNVTFGTVGSQSITAVGSELSGTESNLDVSPAAATRFTVAPTVNRPGYYTVTAFDGYGNLATHYAGTVQVSSTDPAAALPPDAMLIDGVGTFRVILETPGRHLILATDSENPDVMGTDYGVVTLSLSGTVYLDTNAGNSFQDGMPLLAGRVVFLDLNGDGTLDPGDPTATTNAQGGYTLYGGQVGEFPVLEATSQDASMRYVVDQVSIAGMSVNIGVVPISPIAPVLVVPSPFSGSPSLDANTAYVESLYRAVLGRTGEGEGVAFWAAGLTSGMTRQGVAEDFINSREHRQDEVNAYYEDFLHRAPDPAGSSFWVNALISGVSEETVAELFLDSPEYQSAHQDSTSFLDNLYLDVLGRQNDGGGLAFWQSALTSGTSRETVVADFVQSTEAIDQVINSDYASFLHREPETGGPTIWMDVLESPNGSASTVAVNILASPEFDEDAVTEIG
jgi:hypothetical protein